MKHQIQLTAVAVVVALTALSPLPAVAQGMSDKIGELISFGKCGQALCLNTGPGAHGAHYLKSAQTAGDQLVNFLTGSITAGVGRLPISATSSGNTVSMVNGALVLGKTSAGPIFAERANTMGRGRSLFGVNTTGIRYSKLRGQSMDSLSFQLAHEDVLLVGLGDSPNERDVIGANLNMQFNLQVSTLFATYGVTDRLDVSMAVPFVMASLDATANGRVFSDATVTGNHYFDTPGTYTKRNTVSGSKAGIGDIAARLKYNLGSSAKSGVAFLADVRLPTGSEKDFLGAGSIAANAIVIASSTFGKFSPHANVGFAIRTGEGQNSAMLGTFGFDQMVSPKFTVAFDLLSEFQAGGDAGDLPPDFTIRPAGRTLIYSGSNVPRSKDNPISLSGGGRFVAGAFTILANGLVPVKSGGLQANFIWTLGVDRRF